jgi:GntR family transcriptional regulator
MEDMKRAGMEASSRVEWAGVEEAHGDVAVMLGVPEGMKVYRVDRLRLGDGEPIAFDMTWLPMVYGQLLDGVDLGNRTLFSLLEEEYGIAVLRGRYMMSAASADARLAGLLGVGEGQALLQLNRAAYTVADRPVYWQKRFYRSDKVSYEILLERGEGAASVPGGHKKNGSEPFDTAPIREITPVFRS